MTEAPNLAFPHIAAAIDRDVAALLLAPAGDDRYLVPAGATAPLANLEPISYATRGLSF